jgi:transcriptional regulator with XRE-family HTH domain
MTVRESFSKALPVYIRRAGMKQRDLANAVGVSESTVHCWMAGKAFPRIGLIEKIAEVLNCSPDDLLDNKESVPGEYLGQRMLNSLGGASQPFHSSLVEALKPRQTAQTPKEDAEMAVLWRNASITAKRAAIAVLKSMEELK